MTGALAGEWTKLASTRAPWWTAALAVLAFGGMAVARTLTTSDPIPPMGLVDGASLGLLITMVLATLAATSDHTTGTHRLALMADANRLRLFAAKTTVVALVSALVAAVGAAVVTGTVFGLAHIPDDWTSGDVLAVWGQMATWSLGGVLAVAVGTLVRRSALAAPLMVAWPVAIEPLASVIPQVGEVIREWLPFTNALAVTTPAAADPTGAGLGHGQGVALAVFAAWTVGFAVLAAVVEWRRDA